MSAFPVYAPTSGRATPTRTQPPPCSLTAAGPQARRPAPAVTAACGCVVSSPVRARALRSLLLPGGPLAARRCSRRSSSQASRPISTQGPAPDTRSGGTYSPKGSSSFSVGSCAGRGSALQAACAFGCPQGGAGRAGAAHRQLQGLEAQRALPAPLRPLHDALQVETVPARAGGVSLRTRAAHQAAGTDPAPSTGDPGLRLGQAGRTSLAWRAQAQAGACSQGPAATASSAAGAPFWAGAS